MRHSPPGRVACSCVPWSTGNPRTPPTPPSPAVTHRHEGLHLHQERPLRRRSHGHGPAAHRPRQVSLARPPNPHPARLPADHPAGRTGRAGSSEWSTKSTTAMGWGGHARHGRQSAAPANADLDMTISGEAFTSGQGRMFVRALVHGQPRTSSMSSSPAGLDRHEGLHLHQERLLRRRSHGHGPVGHRPRQASLARRSNPDPARLPADDPAGRNGCAGSSEGPPEVHHRHGLAEMPDMSASWQLRPTPIWRSRFPVRHRPPGRVACSCGPGRRATRGPLRCRLRQR